MTACSEVGAPKKLTPFERPYDVGIFCPPAIVLSGDASDIAPIAETLRAHGVVAPEGGCAAEHVHVEQGATGLVLMIDDIDGRRVTRTVRDVTTAVAVIESFSSSSERAESNDEAVPAVDLENPLPHGRGTTRQSSRNTISAAEETSLTPDRSVWFGFQVADCVHVGRACVGGRLHVAYDAGLVRNATSEAYRTGADLLMTIERPYVRGSLTFAPSVGIGVGWLRVRGDDADYDDAVSRDSAGMRAEARLAVGVPLGRSVDLRVGASATLSPLAHTHPYMVDHRMAPGDPRAFGRLEIGLDFP